MKKDKFQELKKYSKEEILEALRQAFIPEVVVDSLLARLEYGRQIKAIDEHRAAEVAARTALEAYLAWKKGVVERYGSGGSVSLMLVPFEELQRGVAREKAWNAACEKERALSVKVNRLLGVGDGGAPQ